MIGDIALYLAAKAFLEAIDRGDQWEAELWLAAMRAAAAKHPSDVVPDELHSIAERILDAIRPDTVTLRHG